MPLLSSLIDLLTAPAWSLLVLLAGAGVLGASLQAQGVVQRLVARACRGQPGFAGLCWRMTALVGATAWMLPSTSARAALCLPVFSGLATHLHHPAQRRAMALLLPTTVLLSAGGSLMGAGAHLLAVDALRAQGLPAPGYLDWLLWAAPFAACACGLATLVVLRGMVPAAQRGARIALPEAPLPPWTPVQLRLIGLTLATVLMWALSPWTRVEPALVAVAAALLAAWPRWGGTPVAQALRGVDLRMLLFLAASLLLAEAVVASGVAHWLADRLLSPARQLGPTSLLAAVAAVSLLLHLLVTSRSARVAVLLPALVLPLTLALSDPQGTTARVLVMAAVMGTGFCQTFAISSKAMLLFTRHPQSSIGPGDLLRLSLLLLLPLWVLLMAFGLWVWPALDPFTQPLARP